MDQTLADSFLPKLIAFVREVERKRILFHFLQRREFLFLCQEVSLELDDDLVLHYCFRGDDTTTQGRPTIHHPQGTVRIRAVEQSALSSSAAAGAARPLNLISGKESSLRVNLVPYILSYCVPFSAI